MSASSSPTIKRTGRRREAAWAEERRRAREKVAEYRAEAGGLSRFFDGAKLHLLILDAPTAAEVRRLAAERARLDEDLLVARAEREGKFLWEVRPEEADKQARWKARADEQIARVIEDADTSAAYWHPRGYRDFAYYRARHAAPAPAASRPSAPLLTRARAHHRAVEKG